MKPKKKKKENTSTNSTSFSFVINKINAPVSNAFSILSTLKLILLFFCAFYRYVSVMFLLLVALVHFGWKTFAAPTSFFILFFFFIFCARLPLFLYRVYSFLVHLQLFPAFILFLFTLVVGNFFVSYSICLQHDSGEGSLCAVSAKKKKCPLYTTVVWIWVMV